MKRQNIWSKVYFDGHEFEYTKILSLLLKIHRLIPTFLLNGFSSEQLKERAQLFCETINSPQPKTVWVGKRTNSISFI